MIRVAINGFGRIGRNVLRALYESKLDKQIKVVAINELADPKAIAHLLKYDTSHGRFQFATELSDGQLTVAGDNIRLLSQATLEGLPWQELGIDLVMECTGVYNSRADAQLHIEQGAKKVLFSQPAASDVDKTIVYGVNHHLLEERDTIVSNGSCTTNCSVPVIKLFDQAFGVQSGAITTIHASMHDQQVIDAYHADLRRTRAASQSIIPVDTKLAIGIERILPNLKGRFEAIAVRVPTINVTAMDLSITVNQAVNEAKVNQLLQQAARGDYRRIIAYESEPLVSSDFNHDSHSCIVDSTQTRVSHNHLIKVLLWCDNEWGFANRMLDTSLAMFP